jgi:hypothetical protein
MSLHDLGRFDFVIIGSSPLLLATAALCRKKNMTVLLIDKSTDLGGNWSAFVFKNGLKLETACHLIEGYNVTKDILENLFAQKFISYNREPVFIDVDGRVNLYAGRKSYFKKLIRNIKKLLRIIIFDWRNNEFLEKLYSILFEVKLLLLYRYENIVNKTLLLKPERGFAHFIQKLRVNAVDAGVQFLTAEVVAIRNSCVVCKVDDYEVEICADTIVHGDGFVTDKENAKNEEVHHLLISVKNCFDYTLIPEYIHLPHDKIIHRITHEGKLKDQRFFLLVQVRNTTYTKNEIIVAINDILTRFISTTLDLNLNIECTVSQKVYSSFTMRTDQGNSIVHLRTNGNLSRNVISDFKFYSKLLDDE